MPNVVSLIKLLSPVADGSIRSVSSKLTDDLDLTAEPNQIIIKGDVGSFVDILGRLPNAPETHFGRRKVIRMPENALPEELVLSSMENPHPGFMTTKVNDDKFRLDVDYFVTAEDITRYSLISRAGLSRAMNITSPITMDMYLWEVPRFAKKQRSLIYYHPEHCYRVFSEEYHKRKGNGILTENNIKVLYSLASSAKYLIRPTKYMFWYHSPKNPWMVSFRALSGLLHMGFGTDTISVRVRKDISKEYPGLIDMRDVLRKISDSDGGNFKWRKLRIFQRNTLRLCILEINQYATLHGIACDDAYADLDLTEEPYI